METGLICLIIFSSQPDDHSHSPSFFFSTSSFSFPALPTLPLSLFRLYSPPATHHRFHFPHRRPRCLKSKNQSIERLIDNIPSAIRSDVSPVPSLKIQIIVTNMFLINDAKLISPDRVKGVNMCKGDTSLSFNPGKPSRQSTLASTNGC